LAPKSHPKQTLEHSKTPQKNIPKSHRKSTPNFIDFWLKMTPKMSSEIVQNSTRGALWGHTGPQEAQKGGPGSPWDPKRRSRAPPGHNFQYFWILPWMFFNMIHDLLSTMPSYVRIYIQCQKIKETGKLTHEKTNKRPNEQTNERTNERTKNQTNAQPNERTNEHTNALASERSQCTPQLSHLGDRRILQLSDLSDLCHLRGLSDPLSCVT